MRRKTNADWLEEVQDLVGNSYVFLKPYKNTRTKLVYYHVDCGEIHTIRPDDFLHGRRCPSCSKIKRNQSLTKSNAEWLKQVHDLTGDEYEFLDPYAGNHTPIRYRHRVCGKIRTMAPSNFLSGHRCSYCAGLYEDTETYREKLKELYGNEYSLLSEYKRANKMVKIRHNVCGYEWNTNATNFIQGKSHCPRCQESSGERTISQILDAKHVKYIQQYVFDDCRYKRPLPFDFYLPDYNLCIEYDGKQHYVKNEFFNEHDPFKERQIKDHIKNKYCKEHGINMLRIPYNHTQSLEDIIMKRLQGIKH